MKQREPIRSIMKTELHTVNTTQKLSEVYDLMQEESIHHVPVVEGERLIGLLSSADILRHTYGNTFAQDEKYVRASLELSSIREAMTEDLLTLNVDSHVKDAVELLSRGDLHALPVVDGARLAGMVTSTDVIRHLGDQY